MGVLSRIRAGTWAPDDDRYYSATAWGPTVAGVVMSPEAALTLSAVWQAVRRITEGIAAQPCLMYRYLPNGGRERATNHPLFELLRWQPNAWQSAMEYWEMVVGHVLLRGNAYSEIVGGARGFADALIPLHPDRVEVERLRDGTLRYTHRPEDSHVPRVITPDRMFHVRGLSQDGVLGLSVIKYGANAFGANVAAESYAGRFFGQGATAALAAIHPGRLGAEGQKNLRSSLTAYAAGLKNAHSILVLEEGMKIEQLGIKPEDAQLLATREYGVRDVARWFNIDPVFLGVNETSTYASQEAKQTALVTDTLQPWAVRIEQAIRRDLIIAADAYFAEFLLANRLRGDSAARGALYQSAIASGWMTRNEVRQRENLNPLPGLDAPLQPLNMAPAGTVPTEQAEDRDAEDETDERPARAAIDPRVVAIVDEAAARLVRKELACVRRLASKHAEDAAAWLAACEAFYVDHVREVATTLKVSPRGVRALADAHLAALRDGGVIAADWDMAAVTDLVRMVWGVDGGAVERAEEAA